MECSIELLTYEKGLLNKQNILKLMEDLCAEEGAMYCMKKTNELLSFLDDKTAIVAGAFMKEELVGYIWGYLRDYGKIKRIHITQFVVERGYRKLGIGKELLDFIQNECQNIGCNGLELNVEAKNDSAYKFYRNNDFRCETLFLVKSI